MIKSLNLCETSAVSLSESVITIWRHGDFHWTRSGTRARSQCRLTSALVLRWERRIGLVEQKSPAQTAPTGLGAGDRQSTAVIQSRQNEDNYYYYYYYYYMRLLTLHMSTFNGRIMGADGISWWSPSHKVLATNYWVCKCMCVRVTALSGIYYSGPASC